MEVVEAARVAAEDREEAIRVAAIGEDAEAAVAEIGTTVVTRVDTAEVIKVDGAETDPGRIKTKVTTIMRSLDAGVAESDHLQCPQYHDVVINVSNDLGGGWGGQGGQGGYNSGGNWSNDNFGGGYQQGYGGGPVRNNFNTGGRPAPYGENFNRTALLETRIFFDSVNLTFIVDPLSRRAYGR